jgi:hypothetical protein
MADPLSPGQIGGASLADPVWRIHPLTELIFQLCEVLKARGTLNASSILATILCHTEDGHLYTK